MSLCEDMLLCNYRKCRAKLSGYAWVTACSHIFCDQHGSGEFSRSPAVCPACSSTLSGKLDIVRTELSPSEEYKAMVLAGLRPEIVLDISSRALAFWTYQVHQEHLYQEYNFSRAESHLKQMEKVYTQQIQSKDVELTSMKGEVTSLKRVLEEYKKKFSDISEKLMERNRQYQKLQSLYDSLRLRNIALANHEGSMEPTMPSQPPALAFSLGKNKAARRVSRADRARQSGRVSRADQEEQREQGRQNLVGSEQSRQGQPERMGKARCSHDQTSVTLLGMPGGSYGPLIGGLVEGPA
uniref:Cyclin B1 interacting protein 1 n=1 Tax=Ornithorhynchus anatinus TaxID=9258 RepID=A0A6I8P4D9_ORNAN